jgi:hypothetical protein
VIFFRTYKNVEHKRRFFFLAADLRFSGVVSDFVVDLSPTSLEPIFPIIISTRNIASTMARGVRTKRVPPRFIGTPSPAAASAAASASRGSAFNPTINSGGTAACRTAAASSTTRGRVLTPIDTGAALSTNRGGTAVGYKFPEDTFCVILANNETLTAEMTGVDSHTFRNSFDLDDNQIVCASGLACTHPDPVD